MPGCLNGCYLYSERHEITRLDVKTQIQIENEIEKSKKGEDFDANVISKAVTRRCLGDFLKEPGETLVNCKHYWELPEDLSFVERMSILSGKNQKRWFLATIAVTIIGIISTSLFAYLNFTKPSSNDLNNELNSTKFQVDQCEQRITKMMESCDVEKPTSF